MPSFSQYSTPSEAFFEITDIFSNSSLEKLLKTKSSIAQEGGTGPTPTFNLAKTSVPIELIIDLIPLCPPKEPSFL